MGKLSISFHDSTKNGALVSHIMTDVEGVRNLVGSGLMECRGITHGRHCSGGFVPNQHADDGARVWRSTVSRTRFEEGIPGRSTRSFAIAVKSMPK